MTISRKKSKLITGALLILLMSATFALPSGMHLQFCFGDDGHFDIALNSCPDVPKPQPQQHEMALAVQNHHDGGCLDVTFVCDFSEKLVRHAEKIGLLKTKIKNISLPASGLVASGLFANPTLSGPRASSFLAPQTSPSFHLASLRTIVLLI